MSSSTVQFVFYNNPDGYPPIINSARLLVNSGMSVNILCRQDNQTWDIAYPPEVKITRIRGQNGNSWAQYLGFVRHVMRQADSQAAIFMGHDMHGLLPARLLATRYRRPLVYHCHDFAESGRKLSPGSQLASLFERRFARTAQLVIVPDEERGNLIAQELQLSRKPLVVANAPLGRFELNSDVLQTALKAQGREFSRVLFRQGRIGPGHAIETTLRSIPYWQDPGWGFVIMGRSDEVYIQYLWKLADELGVTSRFAILPPTSYDEVGQFTVGANVGHALYEPIHVNHRYSTTASNKLMEYMAAGLPILTSDRPGLRGLVEHYACGITADESDRGSIAVAVNTLMGNLELAIKMGHSASEAFERVFRYDVQFAPALEALQRLASV